MSPRARLWLLSLVFVVMPGSVAAAAPFMTCNAFVSWPAHGATAVPLDAVVQIKSTCGPLVGAPRLLDAAGQEVPFKLTDGSTIQLEPLAPLSPDTAYRVVLPGADSCDSLDGGSHFTTAVKPGVRYVSFQVSNGKLMGANVFLSEPVLDPADLAQDSTAVAGVVDDWSKPGQILPLEHDGLSFSVYFKAQATQPEATATLKVRLHQGLRFKSGAVLAQDLEVAVSPAKSAAGWYAVGQAPTCPLATAEPEAAACRASAGGGGGWATAAGLLSALAIVMRRRRRRARMS